MLLENVFDFVTRSGEAGPLKDLFQQTLLPNITLVLVLILRMNNHCLQQQSVNSARTENILNLTIRTWWLRSRSVKTFSKGIWLARQLKYYLPSLVTISISQILGDTWLAFTMVFPKRTQRESLGTMLSRMPHARTAANTIYFAFIHVLNVKFIPLSSVKLMMLKLQAGTSHQLTGAA